MMVGRGDWKPGGSSGESRRGQGVASDLGRREVILGGAAAIAMGRTRRSEAACGGGPALRADVQAGEGDALAARRKGQFLLGLNTSTIRGQKLSIVDEIELARKAGYQAMEPWIDELERYAGAGGSLADLAKRFRDAGISVESAIGFFEWVVDDPERRRKGFESARRAMDLVRKIGGKRLAAPPVGATDRRMADLLPIAERYRSLLELGDQLGVVPQVEVWGGSKTLSRLGEAAQVALEAQHPRACILPDVYHLYRGGSGFSGIKLLGQEAIHVFHFNDYPADPPREKATDADRVYPGDGVAPLKALLHALASGGFQVTLSLELFNRKLWSQDPLTVVQAGYDKMKALVDGV
jgi:sugar phosphate isomerase/epimerase